MIDQGRHAAKARISDFSFQLFDFSFF